jgi:hypothetical protein
MRFTRYHQAHRRPKIVIDGEHINLPRRAFPRGSVSAILADHLSNIRTSAAEQVTALAQQQSRGA